MRRKLGLREGKIYALKEKQGNIISNFNDVVKATEKFYTVLCSAQGSNAAFIRCSDEGYTEVPSITSDKVKTALQATTTTTKKKTGWRRCNNTLFIQRSRRYAGKTCGPLYAMPHDFKCTR